MSVGANLRTNQTPVQTEFDDHLRQPMTREDSGYEELAWPFDEDSRAKNLPGQDFFSGSSNRWDRKESWWRGQDSNLRPLGYEPNELPDCSTPRQQKKCSVAISLGRVKPTALPLA